jgi:hypothetical protein
MTKHNWGPALWITAEGQLETARAQKYDFATEKRDSLQRWANHVEGLATGAPADDKVVVYPGRR